MYCTSLLDMRRDFDKSEAIIHTMTDTKSWHSLKLQSFNTLYQCFLDQRTQNQTSHTWDNRYPWKQFSEMFWCISAVLSFLIPQKHKQNREGHLWMTCSMFASNLSLSLSEADIQHLKFLIVAAENFKIHETIDRRWSSSHGSMTEWHTCPSKPHFQGEWSMTQIPGGSIKMWQMQIVTMHSSVMSRVMSNLIQVHDKVINTHQPTAVSRHLDNGIICWVSGDTLWPTWMYH